MIPTWEEAERQMQLGTATPTDIFVFSQEPAGKEHEAEFRQQLEAMIAYEIKEAMGG